MECKPNTACTKVLSVVELFQNIIVHLPIRDVLKAKRVSKEWCDNIAKSPRIQVTLGIRPLALLALHDTLNFAQSQGITKRTALNNPKGTGWSTVSPEALHTLSLTPEEYFKICTTEMQLSHATLSPFMHVLFPQSSKHHRIGGHQLDIHTDPRNFAQLSKSTPEALTNVFLTQPPLAQLEVFYELQSQGFGAHLQPPAEEDYDDTSDGQEEFAQAMYAFTDALAEFRDTSWELAKDYRWSAGLTPWTSPNPGLEFFRNTILVNPTGLRVSDLLAGSRMMPKLLREFDHLGWNLRIVVVLDPEDGLDEYDSDEEGRDENSYEVYGVDDDVLEEDRSDGGIGEDGEDGEDAGEDEDADEEGGDENSDGADGLD